jgi:hypothetical protein
MRGDSGGKVDNVGGGSIGQISYELLPDSEWLPGTEVFEFPELSPLNFCLWGLMKSEVYRRNVVTRDEPLAHILDAAARMKKREDKLKRTTRDLRTRVAKCFEVDGGISEKFIANCKKTCNIDVTNLPFSKTKLKLN